MVCLSTLACWFVRWKRLDNAAKPSLTPLYKYECSCAHNASRKDDSQEPLMKTIYGRVLVKESNVGVPNLVVAAYDSERGSLDIAATPGSRTAPVPITERLGKRTASALTGPDGAFTFR